MTGERSHQKRTRISFFPKGHALTKVILPLATVAPDDIQICATLLKIHFPIVLMLTICQHRLLDTIPKACGTLTCSEESSESLSRPQLEPTQ